MGGVVKVAVSGMTIPEFQREFLAAQTEREKLAVALKALSGEGYCMGIWPAVAPYKQPQPSKPIQVLAG